jgi:hypothetical protein
MFVTCGNGGPEIGSRALGCAVTQNRLAPLGRLPPLTSGTMYQALVSRFDRDQIDSSECEQTVGVPGFFGCRSGVPFRAVALCRFRRNVGRRYAEFFGSLHSQPAIFARLFQKRSLQFGIVRFGRHPLKLHGFKKILRNHFHECPPGISRQLLSDKSTIAGTAFS